MNNPAPPTTGIARFIPGIALFKGARPIPSFWLIPSN